MVKIMFEEGSGADYILNARMTVEMSFMGLEKVDKTTKGYGSFLIILIVQKARKG